MNVAIGYTFTDVMCRRTDQNLIKDNRLRIRPFDFETFMHTKKYIWFLFVLFLTGLQCYKLLF
jgi:hypothetical protein